LEIISETITIAVYMPFYQYFSCIACFKAPLFSQVLHVLLILSDSPTEITDNQIPVISVTHLAQSLHEAASLR